MMTLIIKFCLSKKTKTKINNFHNISLRMNIIITNKLTGLREKRKERKNTPTTMQTSERNRKWRCSCKPPLPPLPPQRTNCFFLQMW